MSHKNSLGESELLSNNNIKLLLYVSIINNIDTWQRFYGPRRAAGMLHFSPSGHCNLLAGRQYLQVLGLRCTPCDLSQRR